VLGRVHFTYNLWDSRVVQRLQISELKVHVFLVTEWPGGGISMEAKAAYTTSCHRADTSEPTWWRQRAKLRYVSLQLFSDDDLPLV
jgi:hypothetical protein